MSLLFSPFFILHDHLIDGGGAIFKEIEKKHPYRWVVLLFYTFSFFVAGKKSFQMDDRHMAT